MASGGFVYVITNRAMPGLVKVGRTTRMPEERARELGGAGAPYPYEVRYALRTRAHRAVEAAAHRLLRSVRLQHEGGGVEWFACTVREARKAIRRAARKIDGVFEPGSFMHHLVTALETWLRRIDILVLLLALATLLLPVWWPFLARHAASWLPMLAPLQWDIAPTELRGCQVFAGAWLGVRLIIGWAVHRRQLGVDYASQPTESGRSRQRT